MKGFSDYGKRIGRPLNILVGKRFGMLHVEKCLEESQGDLNDRGLFLCVCDCGKTKEVSGKCLQQKRGTRSCGCLMSIVKTGANYKLRIDGESVIINKQYHIHINNALDRGCKPLLKEDWLNIVKNPCHYCGEIDTRTVPSCYTSHIRYRNFTEEELSKYIAKINGIDRVDNSIDYSLENSVSCCKQCNIMKLTYSQEDFFNKIQLIYNKHFSNTEYSNIPLELFLID